MKFCETTHCTSHAHCTKCRDLEDGRRWRESLARAFDITQSDFECPEGYEWGSENSNPTPPAGKRKVKYLANGKVLIDGVECVPCSEKRRLRVEALKAKRETL